MSMQSVVIKSIGRGGFLLKKYSPEILLGVGIVGSVASTVLACKATLKVDQVLEENKRLFARIDEAKAALDKTIYSEDDYKHDVVIVYVKASMNFVKLYGPSVSLGLASIGLILTSHGILSKRNAAILAAYKVLDSAYSNYRKKVIADVGEEADAFYRFGVHKEKVTEKVIDSKGKEKEVEKEVLVAPNSNEVVDESVYARWFDESSLEWKHEHNYNIFFLKAQQNHANDMLHAHGHLFLNEVYDMLGIPRSNAGAIVGWVNGGSGDDFVDFGIFNPKNEVNRDYINGYENRAILLDFNVQGPIWDLI